MRSRIPALKVTVCWEGPPGNSMIDEWLIVDGIQIHSDGRIEPCRGEVVMNPSLHGFTERGEFAVSEGPDVHLFKMQGIPESAETITIQAVMVEVEYKEVQ